MKTKTLAAFCTLTVATFAAITLPQPAHAGSLFTPETIKKAMLDLYCQFPGQPADAGCKEGTPGAAQAPTASTDPSAVLDARPAPKELTESGKQTWKLTTADQKVWALELFDTILALEPDLFNETLKDLAQDYYAYPEHRAGIELLLSMFDVQRSAGAIDVNDHTADAVRARLREELYARRNESNVTRVLDRAFKVLLIGSAIRGAGVGPYKAFQVWRSGGVGLSRMESTVNMLRATIDGFKYTTKGIGFRGNMKALFHGQFKTVFLNFARDKRIQLLAAGSTWSAVDIVLDSFRTFKIDPHHALEPVQELILEDAGRDAAAERDELRKMLKESDEELRLHAQTYRPRLLAIDLNVTKLTKEIGYLYEVAAQYRPRMEPIAQDLSEIRQSSRELFLRYSEMDIEATWETKMPLK